MKYMTRIVAVALLVGSPALAQNPPAAPAAPPQGERQGAPPEGRQGGRGRGRAEAPPPGPGRSNNPFTTPIPATEGVIKVNYVEFATVPDAENVAPRMNLLIDEPGTRRMFVNTMTGLLYAVSYDGKAVTPYLDLNDPKWEYPVQSSRIRTGLSELRLSPAIRSGRHARLRQVLHLRRHAEHLADSRFRPARRQAHARRDSARVDREDSESRGVRRRAAARAVPGRASVRQPQRRTNRLQSRSRGRARRSSGCSTSGRPTAAAAAIP